MNRNNTLTLSQRETVRARQYRRSMLLLCLYIGMILLCAVGLSITVASISLTGSRPVLTDFAVGFGSGILAFAVLVVDTFSEIKRHRS